ncbi:hypothetical protein DRP07_11465 [Archaeoglobales archaeon]|nr:MAG: hypothetical protein DRP07_11465 [Archaeoglobales archaeon]
MNSVEERKEFLRRIIESFDLIKKLLKEKAICEEDKIVVFDPPFTLHILRNQGCIYLYHNDEELGYLSLENYNFCDAEAEVVMDSWLKTLTSFGFRRYIVKRR